MPSVWTRCLVAEVSGGLEGGGDGQHSHSPAIAVSILLGKRMTIAAPGSPLP